MAHFILVYYILHVEIRRHQGENKALVPFQEYGSAGLQAQQCFSSISDSSRVRTELKSIQKWRCCPCKSDISALQLLNEAKKRIGRQIFNEMLKCLL